VNHFLIVNRDMNRESQMIRDDSRNSQRLQYIFMIHIEKILNHIESYDSNRESYDLNITILDIACLYVGFRLYAT
jgi:hypothetical protein